MHFQQVVGLALAFSADHNGSLLSTPADLGYGRSLSLKSPLSTSRLVIEEDALASGDEWHVRLVRTGSLMPSVYFPPVHTPQELRTTLLDAWEVLDGPVPFLSRSTEFTAPQPRSASPLLRRTHSMTQMPPRRE